MLSHIYCLLLWCTENLSFFDQCVSSVRYETTTYSWQLFLARSIFFFLELLLFGNTLYKLFDCTCTKIGTPFLISILLKRKPLNHWIFHEFSMFRTNYYFNSMHFESVKQQQKRKKNVLLRLHCTPSNWWISCACHQLSTNKVERTFEKVITQLIWLSS